LWAQLMNICVDLFRNSKCSKPPTRRHLYIYPSDL